MKRLLALSGLLVVLSLVSGMLFSKMSFIGRVGINIFYQEYTFLKTWWKGSLMVFTVLFVLMLIHYFIQHKLARNKAIIWHIIALMIALVGLYLTYSDFQNDYAHRWMKEKFHLGGYLFWLGWISIIIFFLFENRKQQNTATDKM